ncbi:hypothetical protein DL769_005506 [Monosporascus sp. CRB-8-3]|nr:hypothetical protein DL769_005506 [Monosporascus sp. CRB-8-3]
MTNDKENLDGYNVHGSNRPRAALPGFTEHVFTSSSGVEQQIRVWPADPPLSSPAPFVTWTHGGGWFAGNNFGPLAWMHPGMRARGYHLVSNTYRLGPQVRVDEQVDDCIEAIAWCRANLPKILGADKVDVDRYVICGESAGGTMVTLMGHRSLSPPPRAIIDCYGVTDLLDLIEKHGWKGGIFPSSEGDAKWEGEFSQEELEAFLGDRNPKNIVTQSLFGDEHTRLKEKTVQEAWLAPNFKYTKRIRLQADLHTWRVVVKSKTALSFLRGSIHSERFSNVGDLKKYITSVSSLRLLEGKESYPPTAFLHGTGDEAVSLEQSKAMASKLREMGVPVIECYEPNLPHVFDNKYTSPDVPGWDTYIQPLLDFVNHHVNK